MQMASYSALYVFDGIKYNVVDTMDVHHQLESDPNFFASYIRSNEGCLEADVSMAEHENGVASNDSCVSANNLGSWTSNKIKLFLELYGERKEKFRDPKCKKRSLWTEIKEDMKKNGCEGFNEDMLDREMRNLKKTYRTIKDNNRKSSTGRGHISCEFYDTFEHIFSNDSTINFGPTVSSFRLITVTVPSSSSSMSPLLPTATTSSPISPEVFNETVANESDAELQPPNSDRAKKIP